MIYGVGVDIVDVEQISKTVLKRSRFIDRIFTQSEILYCESSLNQFERFAVRFAAKEAFVKAIHWDGTHTGIKWRNIEVCHLPSGEPAILLHNEYKNLYSTLKIQ